MCIEIIRVTKYMLIWTPLKRETSALEKTCWMPGMLGHSVNLSSGGQAEMDSLVWTARAHRETLSQKRTMVVRCSSAQRRMRQEDCVLQDTLSQQMD